MSLNPFPVCEGRNLEGRIAIIYYYSLLTRMARYQGGKRVSIHGLHRTEVHRHCPHLRRPARLDRRLAV